MAFGEGGVIEPVAGGAAESVATVVGAAGALDDDAIGAADADADADALALAAAFA